ncbi:DNA ligase 4 [Chiua virens]|nr:DNA ligase 4 [Chiua virens]
MARLTENLNLQRGFLRHLDKLESIQVLQKLKVESIQPEVDSNGWPLVHLSDGTTIRARLLIASNVGADGFSSPVRSYAGISSYGWSYDTQAVVATLNRAPRGAFERPNHIAYQRFLPTGPIAFLPLSPTVSSLVWSTRLRHAAALCKSGPDVLASMINAAFRLPEVSIRYLHDRILEAEAAGATLSHDAIKDEIAFRERSNNISKYPAYALPSLRLPSQAGTIASFPLRYNHTEAYLGEGAGSRTVLMGDAAHTIHPLAGQGLDLGLGDVECPARCIDQTLKHGGDIGSYTALRPYASERYFENHKVMSAVDKLHKLYSSTVEPIISKDTFAPSSRSGSSEPISEDTIYQAPPQNKGSALFPSLLVSLPSYPLSASRDVEGVFLMLGLIAGGNKSVTIFITVLRLIIPQVCSLNISPQEEWFKDIQKDRGRAVYGLKEKNLAKAYIKLIPLGMKDPDASRLLNWKRPSGKFVESKRSSVVEGSLSVDDLNGILDELSKNIGKQDVQSKILQRIYNRSTAEEQKWMVRIILKDMVISVKEITVFSVFHPDAEDLLNTCSDLKKVAWELSDPTRRLKAEVTVPVCSYDWHRKGKDYIGLYGKHVGEGSLTPHIDAAFDERVEEIILDGEMLVWDPVSERKFPFGTLKTAALDKSKAEHNPRLCFKVFDLLYLNGMSLHNKSLKFRKRNLHAWIQEISGRIEFMVEFEGKTAKDVRQRMGEVMAARGEGLILKHPDSVYTLNGRNKDWIKVKPEYMDDLGETVDVLVVGTNSGKLWN